VSLRAFPFLRDVCQGGFCANRFISTFRDFSYQVMFPFVLFNALPFSFPHRAAFFHTFFHSKPMDWALQRPRLSSEVFLFFEDAFFKIPETRAKSFFPPILYRDSTSLLAPRMRPVYLFSPLDLLSYRRFYSLGPPSPFFFVFNMSTFPRVVVIVFTISPLPLFPQCRGALLVPDDSPFSLCR